MMRARVSLPLFALVTLLFAGAAGAADFQNRGVNIVPFGGWTFFDNELQAPTGLMLDDDYYFGGRIGLRLISPLWLDLAGGYTPTTSCDCEATWTHLSANLMLVSSKPRAINPFLSLGGGISKFVPRWSPDETDGTFEAAAGVKVKLTDALGLRLEARNVLLVPKEEWKRSHIDNIIVGAGVVFAFGGSDSDSDGDGVPDKLDKCPDTPRPCAVDANGCPIDSDGDGVCDGLDKCADTPSGARVDLDGCPISEVRQRETELLDTGLIRLQDVNFETAKSNILPESHHALDVVGEVLAKWPQLKIEVGGHCDSRGSDAYNLALSKRRVASVRAYLLKQFPKLEAAQLTARGYGESEPLVPNTSPENMAQNRRVEFKVLNKEDLKQIKR